MTGGLENKLHRQSYATRETAADVEAKIPRASFRQFQMRKDEYKNDPAWWMAMLASPPPRASKSARSAPPRPSDEECIENLRQLGFVVARCEAER